MHSPPVCSAACPTSAWATRPLLRLDKLTAHLPGIQILGKAEWTNPGGSVKDRAATAIVAAAQAAGRLLPGQNGRSAEHLLDATSGNTGIAYAMLGAALGFPVTLCMPTNVSPERKRILAAYGANIVWTDPADGSDGAIRKARELAANDPERYFYADQYGNENNWKAHYYGTANEIWRQTEGRLTHFIAGLGTSGTFMGGTRRLRELNPVHPLLFHAARLALQRPRRPETHAHRDRPSDLRRRPRRPQHRDGNRARTHHGPQIWAANWACSSASPPPLLCRPRSMWPKKRPKAGREAIIVTILCDSADKYLSERFWNEL